jgi:hypothetical protein
MAMPLGREGEILMAKKRKTKSKKAKKGAKKTKRKNGIGGFTIKSGR